ncbi:uncharacterized protein C8A04DRAFT_12569, partial [Dichotomopilus funicola]
ATVDTVELGDAHAPKQESLRVFEQIEDELKQTLIHTRHEYNKHEPEYFAAVKHLSNAELTGFTAENFQQVRVAVSTYGLHLFGKVRIPALDRVGPSYIHFRAFTGGPDERATLHSIHTEDKQDPSGGHTYRAVFTENDRLEWFDT